MSRYDNLNIAEDVANFEGFVNIPQFGQGYVSIKITNGKSKINLNLKFAQELEPKFEDIIHKYFHGLSVLEAIGEKLIIMKTIYIESYNFTSLASGVGRLIKLTLIADHILILDNVFQEKEKFKTIVFYSPLLQAWIGRSDKREFLEKGGQITCDEERTEREITISDEAKV